MDAEDTLHDGFMKVFNNIKQYKGDGPFEGWMRRIMVNTALEKYRRDQKLSVITEQIRYESSDSIEHILEEIASEEIMEVVHGLTPQYRMTFLLYAIEGYNHKEIAEKLNITEGTSKSNLSRARVILQERLREHYTEQNMDRKVIPIVQ
jgi:RNA polymerase sigma-70 factor (ECF subfamily)